jgi:CheY-like chemotaxis protein
VAEGLLAPYKMNVKMCDNGADALKLLQTEYFDLVFMDHMMPGMDGMETTAKIRALSGRFAAMPIIALTANAVIGMREVFLENGFTDFLSKPIEVIKLGKIVDKWIPAEKRKPIADLAAIEQLDEFFPKIAGLDADLGLMRSGGKEKNYLAVLKIYCRDVDSRLQYLNTSSAAQDLKEFTSHSHALKSASANVGAVSLSEMAADIEDAGRRGDIAAISRQINEFRARLETLVNNIRRALQKFEEEDTAALKPEDEKIPSDKTLARLKVLKAAFIARDVGKIDAILDELDKLPHNPATKNFLAEIAQMSLVSEFDQAVGKIEAFVAPTDADENS